MGAFEALEWAWHMLRTCKDKPKGVEKARHLIEETLTDMGKGSTLDFSKKIVEAKDLN